MKVSQLLIAALLTLASVNVGAAEALTCQTNMAQLKGELSTAFTRNEIAAMSPYEMRITIDSFNFYTSGIQQVAEYFEIADNGDVFIQKVKDPASGEEWSTVWFSAGDNYFGYTFDSKGTYKFSFFDSTCED